MSKSDDVQGAGDKRNPLRKGAVIKTPPKPIIKTPPKTDKK